MLKEMVEFSVRTLVTAEEWAHEREGALTEELDAHLRAHRWVGPAACKPCLVDACKALLRAVARTKSLFQ